MLIDTHAHLSAKQFNHDLDQIFNNAKQAQVVNIIIVGVNEFSNPKVIQIAHQYEGAYVAVGIHPGDADNAKVESVLALLSDEKVVAVGEIGIDLHWRQDNLAKQKEVFVKQIEIAIKHNLPVIIHTRNSFNVAYELIKPYIGKLKGVFHCFSSTYEDAKKVVDAGLLIGIGGPITYPKPGALIEIVTKIPLKSIVIETDCPYLPPVPHRGQRNEPAYVQYVAQKIAEIKNISFEQVALVTSQNAIDLFDLPRGKEK